MEKYRKILVAVNSSEVFCQKLIKTAKSLAVDNGTSIRLIYVLRSTYVAALNFKIQKAKQTLSRLGRQFDIPQQELKVRIGHPKSTVFKEAEKIGSDLVILADTRQTGGVWLLPNKICRALETSVMTWDLSPVF